MGCGKLAGGDDVVAKVLQTVANLSDFNVQCVFKGITIFPPISIEVLSQTAVLVTEVFEGSRETSLEDLIRPPRSSARLLSAATLLGAEEVY